VTAINMAPPLGLIMTSHLPDGRRRMQPMRDSTTGEPVAFSTEAEAPAVATRLGERP